MRMSFYSNARTDTLQQHSCQDIASPLSWSQARRGRCSYLAFHILPLSGDGIQLHSGEGGMPHGGVTLSSASLQVLPSRSPLCAWCWKEAPGHST